MAEPTKTLYHGELRKLGPVAVTVTSEPTESTKQKGTYYVELQVEGRQRYYHPENDACLEFWRGRRGQSLTVMAIGAREEAAFETEGDPVAAQPPRQTPASTSAAKPTPTPSGQRAAAPPRETVRQPAAAPAHGADDPLAAAKHHVARNLTLARIALKATAALAKDYAELNGAPISPQMEVAAFTCLLFGANASVPVARLPLDIDIKTLKERVK
jgi:hypothetical protein